MNPVELDQHRFAIVGTDGAVVAEADTQEGADLAVATLTEEGYEDLDIVEYGTAGRGR